MAASRALARILTHAALLAAACDDDSLGGDGLLVDARGRGGRLDSGWDGGSRADARTDAGRGDGAQLDADGAETSDLDAVGADAAEISCECPVLPASCPAMERDRAMFTPGSDDAMGSLLGVLACATSTFEAAFYETTWDCLVSALEAKLEADPDLTMRLVLDDDECPRVGGALTCSLGPLEANPRVHIVIDDRSALMHHKFAIADGSLMWAGSANMVRRSFCTDFNDALLIDQPEIVAAYGRELDRLHRDHFFGPRDPEPPATGGIYSVRFGPETPVSSPAGWFVELTERVATASVSVDFAIAAWTRSEVADALIAAHSRGVRVRGVVSSLYANDLPAELVSTAGLDVRKGNIHAKLAVIDGRTVITGSPNWSAQAWENNEASLWIESSTVAADYVDAIARQHASGSPIGI
ncbi:MAG: hypothetical protein HYV07_26455 [Deltaproteobacteria bacterium]|nr:hypothetical protein [Deltaproteobacteria bacterium]